ncbi:MAG: exosome complex RNA-binding protein Rrp4 [Thermoproteota archaeon]|nr:exosome complex RNA-binding protein Rrp4 [Thermoproteota archaeon]
MPTFFERRDLVTPGDLLAEGDYIAGENTFKDNGQIYAERIGLVEYKERMVEVVALQSFYIPRIGDTIIGKIVKAGMRGWSVDIKAPYLASLRATDALGRPFDPKRDDLFSILEIGDLVIAKVVAYDRTSNPLLTVRDPSLGKIAGGQIVEVTPSKIPRLIGRKGSMINMIKQGTHCKIILGQNGLVLVRGKTLKNEQLAIKAIRKVERESHTSGLTDRVNKMIIEEK